MAFVGRCQAFSQHEQSYSLDRKNDFGRSEVVNGLVTLQCTTKIKNSARCSYFLDCI